MNITVNEEWRPVTVANLGNHYEVSNLGRVRSIDRIILTKNGRSVRRFGQIIRTSLVGNPKGTKKYIHIVLCNRGRKSGFLVHRLVALAFIPNPMNLPEVNHIDGIKTTNVIGNLEWSTESQNREHATKLGLYTGSKPKLSDGDVIEVRRMSLDGINRTDIARHFNVSIALISLIVRNKHRIMRPQGEI